MRRSFFVAAIGATLLAALLALAASATASTTTATVPATVRTIVRPVTSSGHPVSGYSVTYEHQANEVDCSYPSASSAAVDDDIFYCSPDAAYAVACWRAASPGRVLCLDRADDKKLVSFRTEGKIAHVKAPKNRGPLDLKLADGVFCGIRDGGAGSELRQHPSWYASYYCTSGQAVWAAHSYGIHRNGKVWTVQLANSTGKKHVHTVRISRAWLVGTAS